MTLRDTIPINKDDIPYNFDFDLEGKTYMIGINWNPICRQYVIDLWDNTDNAEEPIYLGEPVILNQRLWRNMGDSRLPLTPIIPMDESGLETEINPDNFGDTVQLCLDDLGDDVDGAS